MPSAQVQHAVERWREAGLIDAATAERIAQYEAGFEKSAEQQRRLSLPQIIAVTFGAVLLSAGLLLFVAAHWDELGPMQRFGLVVGTLTGIHLVAAFLSGRTPALSRALHVVGSIALGAGIALTGQIFNLNEHWPSGILLWAVGAWLAWLILEDWTHAAVAALLTPAWLLGEWDVATTRLRGGEQIAAVGVALLALVYFTARSRVTSVLTSKDAAYDSAMQALRSPRFARALQWCGGLALLPALIWVMDTSEGARWYYRSPELLPASLKVIGWAVALGLPLSIAYLLHKKEAWPAALAAGWIVVLGFLPVPWTYWARNDDTGTLAAFLWHGLSSFLWTAFGSSLLIWWGVREHRRERINMGIVGFALSVVSFYFSQLFDMLGRSWSLILLGVIFLGGGYLMERTRRRLLAQIAPEGARA